MKKIVVGNLYDLSIWFRTNNNNHCTGETGQLECWNIVQDKQNSQLRSPAMMENQRGSLDKILWCVVHSWMLWYLVELGPTKDHASKENQIKLAISWPSWWGFLNLTYVFSIWTTTEISQFNTNKHVSWSCLFPQPRDISKVLNKTH